MIDRGDQSQGGATPRPLPAPKRGRVAISRIAASGRRLPPLMRAGFAVLLLGGIADLVYHAATGLRPHGHDGAAGLPTAIHLATAIGMVLSLIGLTREGARSMRRREPAEGGR